MYSFSITDQLRVFAESFGFGFLLGAAYTLVYFISGLFASFKKRVIICDIIFSFLAVFMLFTFVIAFNYGKIRFYSILGIVFGAAVYFLSFGGFLNRFTDKLLLGMRRALSLIFRPFKMICKIFKRLYINLKRKFNNKFKKNLSETIANENGNVV